MRIIVPYAAGGATDATARVLAKGLASAWNQAVVVENKPGAGGQVGAAYVARAPADGYTLLMTSSNQATGPALFKKLSYDPVQDLVAVAGFTQSPTVMVVPGSSQIASLADLLSRARSKPGTMNYGSTGVGSSPHLAFEWFKSIAAVDLVHVPYNGDATLIPALLSGDIQAAMLTPQAVTAYAQSGKLRVIAVASKLRFWALPDAPTFEEAGLTGFEYSAWIGLYAPSNTPSAVVGIINTGTSNVLRDPELVNKLLPTWGVEALHLTPEQAEALYLQDIERFKKIVSDAKIPQLD